MNLCRRCGEDFSSLEGFDAHRVGKHEYLFDWRAESREDGRRCLDADEMREAGMELDARGRWVNPARAQRANQAFGEAA